MQSHCIFSLLKIVKIELANKVQLFIFLLVSDTLSACKTSLFISFISLIGMEWTKASLVGMDLSKMTQFSFIFYKNIWSARLALTSGQNSIYIYVCVCVCVCKMVNHFFTKNLFPKRLLHSLLPIKITKNITNFRYFV